MKTKKFIELITILEEREWEYNVINEKIQFVLGNTEVEIDKYDNEKISEMIIELEQW